MMDPVDPWDPVGAERTNALLRLNNKISQFFRATHTSTKGSGYQVTHPSCPRAVSVFFMKSLIQPLQIML